MDSYEHNLRKEADFWGMMAEERSKGGIPLTMDFQRATRYRVRRSSLGWGDYIQDPWLESLTPFGIARDDFIDFARQAKGKRALDLCCGAGFLSLELARAGKRVDAIDLSRREIAVARSYQAKLRKKPTGSIHWIVADLNTHTFPKNTYDLITAWDGLHHIPHIDRLMAEIHDALKPGGMFLFSERVWGGKQQSFRTRISQGLEMTLNLFLPLAWPYSVRFRAYKSMVKTVFRRYVLRQDVELDIDADLEHHEHDSPFEDTTGKEMLSSIQRHFTIKKMQHFGAFSEEACRSMNLPRFLRVPAILFLSWFDHLFVKTRILDGKIVMGYARKEGPTKA
ncbi:MAG: methyltransferase domain-containing protein [DPANN group archaeon]|nr:methyltransferase domain-containing protein [DPANN group archaeon]